MKWLHCKCFEKYPDVAHLVLRLSAGLVFVAHGWQKYPNLIAFGDFLDSLGVPLSGFFAVLVVGVEIIGGSALILGLFTHWAAKLLALDMLAAFFLFHVTNGLFVQNNGFELVLLLFAASFVLMIEGAGKWSLDARWRK
ncbi:MAG: DoxX family protein [Parcubacteria group bacterium]|nr:DoxX family protein [Parcubacteria group bacterium]MBI2049147.1 DoxX family protein [Parcubacteria group bacterium]